MRIGMLMRDTEYRDALIDMIQECENDIFVEIAGASGAGRDSVILTDLKPDEIDGTILSRISRRTLFLSSAPVNDQAAGNGSVSGETAGYPCNLIFKYADADSILARLALINRTWTGDAGTLNPVSRTISVMGGSDGLSAERCRSLARQIIYRSGSSVIIIPLGFINDYRYSGSGTDWMSRLMYFIDEGRDYPAESFTYRDNYGISCLRQSEKLNPLAMLDREYLERLLISLGGKFDVLILDIGTALRPENIRFAEMSDEIVFFGSSRLETPEGIIGSEAAQRVRIIYKSDPDAESIAIDECIADMFDSRKDQKWNTREEKQSSNTDVK